MTYLLIPDGERTSSWPDLTLDEARRRDTTNARRPAYPKSERPSSDSTKLTITFLGEIEVIRGGKRLPLPTSRKARALLAYLAITGRSHRRDRLCAMLWDTPDDPRGALRSSGYAEYMVAPTQALALIPDDLTSLEATPLLCAGITTFNRS
jgi:hypothetical protein